MASAAVKAPAPAAVKAAALSGVNNGGLAGRVEQLMAGVLPGWRRLMNEEHLLNALAAIDAAGDAARVVPAPDLIFDAFRYCPPELTTVCIVAPEPYESPAVATGLAYSAPVAAQAIPAGARCGLRPLNAGLRGAGVMKGEADACDLSSWAAQGVLLVHRAFTTRADMPGAHQGVWRLFFAHLINNFCAMMEAEERGVTFLLWGAIAGSIAPLAEKRQHRVKRWGEPDERLDAETAAADKFAACPHFREVNAAHSAAGARPIAWDPNSRVVVCTDGSCPKNGKADAAAAFAIVAVGGAPDGFRLSGALVPYALELVDPARPAAGWRAVPSRPMVCTNNRAEYMGVLWSLLTLLRCQVRGAPEVVCDNQACMLMFTHPSWLAKRKRLGTERELDNYDLVLIGDALYQEVMRRTAGRLTMVWRRGHQRAAVDQTPREVLYWRGNRIVDELAGEAAKKLAPGGLLCVKPPAAMHDLLPGAVWPVLPLAKGREDGRVVLSEKAGTERHDHEEDPQ
jgi:uracil-DNA glycosylase